MKSLNHKATKGTNDHEELSATLSLCVLVVQNNSNP